MMMRSLIWLSIPQIGVDRVRTARSHRSHAYPRHKNCRCKNIGGFPGNRLCSPCRAQVINGNQRETKLRRINNMNLFYRAEMVFGNEVKRQE